DRTDSPAAAVRAARAAQPGRGGGHLDGRKAVTFGGRRTGLKRVIENDYMRKRELRQVCRSPFDCANDMEARFSPRQIEIVTLIASGYSDKQIALHLKVSQRTVRTQLERLYAANGLHSRAQAVHIWTISHR